MGATAAALVDLSTVAGNKISNPPWVKFQSAGWVNFPSAPTGYNTLAWFTSEVEANKLLARLREVFLEIRAKQEENYRHEPDSITVKVIKRSIEWIGIVLTALVIAFVGGMTAYPGWKMGEGLYHSVINSSETSDGLSFDSAGELLPPAESPEADSGLEPNQPSEPLPAKD